MPVKECPNGKWRIGEGKCEYDTKETAERAYKGYLGHKYGEAKDMGKQSNKKIAVDESTKDYFVAYFQAFGAQLTRDLAFKKSAKKVAQVDWTEVEPGFLAKHVRDNELHVFGKGNDYLWEVISQDGYGSVVGEGRANSIDEAKQQVENFAKHASKIAQDISGYGNLMRQDGTYVIDDPDYPLKSEPLIVTQQNLAADLDSLGKNQGVPYRAIPFGKAEIYDPTQKQGWGPEDDEWYEKELEKEKAKGKKEGSQESEWMPTDDGIFRHYASGAKAAILQHPEGGYEAAILFPNGFVIEASRTDDLERAVGFCHTAEASYGENPGALRQIDASQIVMPSAQEHTALSQSKYATQILKNNPGLISGAQEGK